METVQVFIGWSGKNFCATNGKEVAGCLVVTDKTLEGVKKAFEETLEFHIEGMLQDGDNVPMWLQKGEYSLNYVLETSALLRSVEKYTTIAAISRVSGINQRQLSHYANASSKPRSGQRERIIQALHEIGKEFILVV